MPKKNLFLAITVIFLSSPLFIKAQDILGQQTNFNVESSYDLSQRTELTATLIRLSPTLYWYIDTKFWGELNAERQSELNQSLTSLSEEFETAIYPKLTRTFGSEWSPGIDKDTRVTVLMHPMKKESGGYFDSSDEYPKVQLPESNEREMIYLNAQYLNTAYAKGFLAHEFIHLITFNQKDRINHVAEDVWLNEARADYAPTLLGYDTPYEGSNLQRRVKDFLDKPSDPLTEWRDAPADYGVANLFLQYLVDHYGVQVLADSLKMSQTGIQSINAVLSKQGFKEDFAQIFTNWTVAVLVNNCQISEKYCYYNENLKDLRVTPLVNYLPFVGQSVLSVTNTTKDWAGNWHKFIGGQGTLSVDFQGSNNIIFKVPYITSTAGGDTSINILSLDTTQNGEMVIPDFGSETVALTIIPIAQNRTADFSSLEPSRTFSWTATTQQEKEIILPSLSPLSKPIFQMNRAELLARITEIQAVIIKLQGILAQLRGTASCLAINQNLYFGMRDNIQVRCLQEFLKNQGSGIYPEGIVNGNFFTLTKAAVVRFQEKYGIQGTGFAGPITRAKINQLLTK
ncbi:MAG: hypothetical protein A2896_01350 [Candidatus Nealsonbacteria bacterium RIFCSPLOWO2_01_FULL_43_32]|uniref:Peptidoglycan binding-like domain-containing protein n=1 Tax=Candidatus Nealsonbacteria bacterium RIFCSPLOWO2_01_FULL_43_32 TaxID=1801672 RepID=A0A1G2EDX4_9BACT|nr:MAG: hypothetical protein A2896_01350 [Candidatus Nealsonbacteria bacterium RIFCSPLOWO2_01_FULL_43_32]